MPPAGNFLVPARKLPKNRLKGITRAPARDAVPLKNPPGPSTASASVSAFGGYGAVREMPNFLKLQIGIPTPPAMRPGGGSGGAWTVLREQDLQRSPPDRLFAYFLGETRK